MRVSFTDKVFVEPVRLLDLETYPGKRHEFLCGDVDDKAAGNSVLAKVEG
jgi:hypothetical protein